MSQQPNVLHAPWDADGHRVYDAYSATVAIVGLASRSRDDAHEIARLIAAAPMLLKALEYVLRVRDIQCTSHPAGDLSCAKCQADLAIREATGGQP